MTAQELLRQRYNEQLANLDRYTGDTSEQLRVRGMRSLGPEITGGFERNEQMALGRESQEYRQGMEKKYKTELEILNEQKKQIDDEARRRKLGSRIGALSSIAGAAASFIPGVGPLVGGAISNIGQYAASSYTGEAPQYDFSFLDDYQGHKEQTENNYPFKFRKGQGMWGE